jgi:hypothetical protein
MIEIIGLVFLSVALPSPSIASRVQGTRSRATTSNLFIRASVTWTNRPPQRARLALLLGVGGHRPLSLGISTSYRNLRPGPESLTCGFIDRSVRARARDITSVLMSELAFWLGLERTKHSAVVYLAAHKGRSGRERQDHNRQSFLVAAMSWSLNAAGTSGQTRKQDCTTKPTRLRCEKSCSGTCGRGVSGLITLDTLPDFWSEQTSVLKGLDVLCIGAFSVLEDNPDLP